VLQVSLLGEQVITDDGAGVRARSSRAVALVAFLVAHAGSPQTRQRIAGMLWPDSTDAQALTNLRRELHQLRQVLGEEPSLVVTARDLCWRDTKTCRVDARIFDRERRAAQTAAAAGDDQGALGHADRAIAQYGGDFLPGMYEDWLLDVRAEFEGQCVELCDLVCRTRLQLGDVAGAATAARRRTRLRPLEEAGYRTLMELQADMGDRAGAVSTYHHCASVLERELGLLPDPATRRAFQRLLDYDQAGDTPRAAEPAGGRSGIAAAQLVGRSGELGVLEQLWRQAVTGRAALALVRGGAGVGKTRLVAEIAKIARRQGAVVASSRCFGASGRLALAPVADWLRNPAVQSAAATLDEIWRVEVDRLVPSGGSAESGVGSRALADAWQRHRFFEGMARAVLAVGRPMLLVLDNMQWCDQETLAFVEFCLGLAPESQILVAGTVRDNPGEGLALADWTDRMRITGLLAELSLSPFEDVDTARLAEAISGRSLSATDAALLQATTGGFPLYVIEAVRGTADAGGTPLPTSDFTAVLLNRLGQASASAREVAGLAAAVGTDFTLDLLSEASDLGAGDVVAAVDELWHRRIVRVFGDGYDFSHDLLRETAYAQITPAKRWLLHRRIAQGLELLHAGDTDVVAAQLAAQYSRGGRPAQALSYYRRAARIASDRLAYAEAIRLLKEALSIVRGLPAGADRDSQELAILETMAAPLNARYSYSSPELQHTLERSIALAESLGRKQSTIIGLVSLWGTTFVQGRTADSYQLGQRALALADPDSELGGQAHFAIGGSAVSLGMPAEGLRHLMRAADLTGGAGWLSIGTRADVHSTAWAAYAHWLLGHDDESLSACREAIRIARSIDDPYCLAVALAYGGITHQLRQDVPALREVAGELRELCARYEFAYYGEWALILDGWSRPHGSGIGLAQQGISNLRAQGSFARMPYWLSLLADLLARDARPDAARATLDAALVAARANDDLWWLPEVMRMRAAYHDEQSAVSRLRSAAKTASAQGSIALLRRCNDDLAGRGVRPFESDVRPSG
jgi:DNA-binding SARP family transcriptional activator/tetratricopeptide (TPR) repeat protein